MKPLSTLGLGLFFLSYPFLASADNCIEERYSFDVGSGAIKTTGNKVDKCKGEIIEKIGEHNVHIKYEHCMVQRDDKLFITTECIEKTREALQNLEKAYNIDCETAKCSGVATAWARKAENSDELLKLFKAEKIDIEVLPQEDEGKLGFYTAKSHSTAKKVTDSKTVVWDLGGGSFQISASDENNNIHVYNGLYGVESYDRMIRGVFMNDGATYFDKDRLDKALEYTLKKIGNKIRKDAIIRNKIAEKDVVVFGIGRPMYRGIRETLKFGEVVTKKDLYNAALTFSGKSVEEVRKMYPELPDHYVRQAQPALILIMSIMEGLGINEIHILNSRASDYIAVDEKYWD